MSTREVIQRKGNKSLICPQDTAEDETVEIPIGVSVDQEAFRRLKEPAAAQPKAPAPHTPPEPVEEDPAEDQVLLARAPVHGGVAIHLGAAGVRVCQDNNAQ